MSRGGGVPPGMYWKRGEGGSGTQNCPTRPTTSGAGQPVSFAQSTPHSNPSEHKLLQTFDPPHPPHPHDPPPPLHIQFQGIEASESKNPLGDRLIGQNNDCTRGWTSNIMPWGMLRE